MSQYPTAAELHRWPAPLAAAKPGVDWRAETKILLVAAAFSTLLGGVVGLIWPRLAPHIDVVHAYYQGSVTATKALLGDDVWFGFLGVLAAVVCVAILRLTAGELARGPGAVLGLAVGGVLGSLVAAHIGTAVQQPNIVAAVHAQVMTAKPTDIARILGYFNFRLRANEMLLAWPVTAVVLVGLNVIARYLRYSED